MGKSDVEIYTWARDRYWAKCAKDLIVWLGGKHGTVMLPGVADYGMVRERLVFSPTFPPGKPTRSNMR